MNIFIDTAAILAVLNADDRFHFPARQAYRDILLAHTAIFSSNYIILETITLLQHRFGIDAVRLFENDLVPVLEIIWVDEVTHRLGTSALMAANRRNLSLVDCTSFEIIRRLAIEKVFTFDPHFQEQGFRVIPELPDKLA
jgi:predicted nucleic acid-binding protein